MASTLLLVDTFAQIDIEYGYLVSLVVDQVEDAVVTYSNTSPVGVAHQLLYARWTGISGQRAYCIEDPAPLRLA
jgi:hypothetical protein